MKQNEYELTDLQKMYLVGEKKDMLLGGRASHAYFEIIVKNSKYKKIDEALKKLVLVQDVFRGVIKEDKFIIKEKMPVKIGHADLSKMNTDLKEILLNEIAKRMFETDFNLEKGPLFTFIVSKISDEESIIHICHSGVIADGSSHEIILKNIKALYDKEEVTLKCSFKDYADYLNELKKSDYFKTDKETLLKRYEGYDFWPELPLKKGESEIELPKNNNIEFFLEKEIYENICYIAKEYELTSFAILFSLFSKIISRYSFNKKFLLNIPVSNRNIFLDGVDEIVGLCSNFIIFDVDDSKNISVLDYAKEVQEKLLAIMDCDTCLGSDVIKELQKNTNGALVAPVVFTKISKNDSSNIENMAICRTRSYTSQVWLEVLISECQEGVSVGISYVEDLFQEIIPKNIGKNYINCINLLSKREIDIKDIYELPLIEEDMEIINKINDTDKSLDERSIFEILEYNFNKYANKPLLCTKNEVLTYKNVKENAEDIAFLVNNNIKDKKSIVGLYLKKGMSQALWEIALLYAGISFLPIDIELPAKAVGECIKRVGIELIITDENLHEKIKEDINCKIIEISAVEKSKYKISDNYNESPVFINTSGTTGVSKTVELSQKAIVNCIFDSVDVFGLTSDITCFAITNYCQDMSLFDFIGIPLIGGSIVIPEDIEKEPDEWIKLMNKYQVNFWNSVPALMQMLILSEEDRKKETFSSLKQVILGGDYLSTKLAEDIKALNENIRLFNVGGPTETTIWNIAHEVVSEDIKKGQIPYGMPFPSTKYYILNEKKEICPVGVKGTMFVEGLGVSKGYVGNKKETEKKFTDYRGKRVYNTGDLGCYTKNGEIIISGRKDFQIKINGKRIEIGQVENAMSEIEKIKSCAVVYNEKIKKMVAFYTGDENISETEVEKQMHLRLPSYMVPTKFYKIDSIPLTANGKTDRKKLIISLENKQNTENNKRENSDIMEKLYQFCEEVFENDEIYEEENFYDMGGDSISAMKLAGKIKRNYNISFSVTDILTNPMLSEVENVIKRKLLS